jgi:hypothetical protein
VKRRFLTTVCAVAIGAHSVTVISAAEPDKGGGAALDVLVARPLCLGATVLGSALFVASLPFSIPAKSVKRSADALVVQPGRATFKRPIGDFSSLPD